MWECPDFFAVSGRHCLFYSTEDKVLWTTGEYDALHHRYVPMRTGVLDHGSAYYAPKSFLAPDGRRILSGDGSARRVRKLNTRQPDGPASCHFLGFSRSINTASSK